MLSEILGDVTLRLNGNYLSTTIWEGTTIIKSIYMYFTFEYLSMNLSHSVHRLNRLSLQTFFSSHEIWWVLHLSHVTSYQSPHSEKRIIQFLISKWEIIMKNNNNKKTTTNALAVAPFSSEIEVRNSRGHDGDRAADVHRRKVGDQSRSGAEASWNHSSNKCCGVTGAFWHVVVWTPYQRQTDRRPLCLCRPNIHPLPLLLNFKRQAFITTRHVSAALWAPPVCVFYRPTPVTGKHWQVMCDMCRVNQAVTPGANKQGAASVAKA